MNGNSALLKIALREAVSYAKERVINALARAEILKAFAECDHNLVQVYRKENPGFDNMSRHELIESAQDGELENKLRDELAILESSLKAYYVWCDGDCQNKTESLPEAIQWCREFRDEGRDSYIVDENNDTVDVPSVASAAPLSV